MHKTLSFLLLGLFIFVLHSPAQADTVFKKSARMEYSVAYKRVYEQLEKARFFVVDEINIGKNLARFKDKWDDYNINKLEQQQVMIICNAWYANQVGNADPDMLALCPMRVMLIHKAGVTTALFARPTVIAANSPALPILKEVEDAITNAIQQALQ